MALREIPFPDSPRWVQDVQLDGAVYTIRMSWNTRGGLWLMDLETADGDRIVSGVRLVLGYPLIGFIRDDRLPPGDFFVLCPSGQANKDPGRDSFRGGCQYSLIYADESEAISGAI